MFGKKIKIHKLVHLSHLGAPMWPENSDYYFFRRGFRVCLVVNLRGVSNFLILMK